MITVQPHREGPGTHAHNDEGDEVVVGPGTFVLVPPGVEHDFANRGDAVV